ncbi:diaminopimelate epimerase [Fictibacillus sp. Mic-4]|uniref:diaminopimelate epimerase n=1 Tax=Fictibacillus sp. Mic-4 TaxID=3132826 RepID=UPI003CF52E83
MGSFRFTKMHGLGNNYIYVNAFNENIEEERLSELAVKVANVHTGIGSDGLILICPSKAAPVKMRIFNNDGSEAKNCGNGLRCVAKYAYENGLVKDTTFLIETLGGLVTATVHVEGGTVRTVTVNMGEPHLAQKEIPLLNGSDQPFIHQPVTFANEKLYMTAVSMGNPHAVFFVDHIEDAPLTTLGPIIEKDNMFPEGVNVEFIEMVSSNELHFRVWERGSGVTQACGTGACAAVVAAILNEKARRNEEITVHLAGGDLIINWTDEGEVFMTGPAEVICEGKFYY